MKCRVLIPLRRVGFSDYTKPESWHQPGDLWDAEKAATPAERDQVLLFVRLGACEPADEECRQAHGMNPAQLGEAQLAYRATAAGVWPEDYELLRQGIIAGYDLDGNYLPGPNYEEPEEQEGEEDG